MKKLIFIFMILIPTLCFAWEPEEYLVYIDNAEGNRLTIDQDKFLHSVRIKKVGTKQLWLLVVRPDDRKFKQKAKQYIANHPELDIQYWRSYKEMYQDTEGIGRTALSHILKVCYDFDSNPETPDTCETVKDLIDGGYTWQQVINNKEYVRYPIQMSNMEFTE